MFGIASLFALSVHIAAAAATINPTPSAPFTELQPLLSTASATITGAISMQPFDAPIPFLRDQADMDDWPLALIRRQNGACPTGYAGCSNLGAPQACCGTASSCTPDASGHVACCPTNAVCTGGLTITTTGGGGGSATSGTATTSGGAVVITGSNTASSALSIGGSSAASNAGTVATGNGVIITIGANAAALPTAAVGSRPEALGLIMGAAALVGMF